MTTFLLLFFVFVCSYIANRNTSICPNNSIVPDHRINLMEFKTVIIFLKLFPSKLISRTEKMFFQNLRGLVYYFVNWKAIAPLFRLNPGEITALWIQNWRILCTYKNLILPSFKHTAYRNNNNKIWGHKFWIPVFQKNSSV